MLQHLERNNVVERSRLECRQTFYNFDRGTESREVAPQYLPVRLAEVIADPCEPAREKSVRQCSRTGTDFEETSSTPTGARPCDAVTAQHEHGSFDPALAGHDSLDPFGLPGGHASLSNFLAISEDRASRGPLRMYYEPSERKLRPAVPSVRLRIIIIDSPV